MILIIECLILCLLFTIFAFSLVINPVNSLFNYPPAIQKKVKSLNEYQGKIPTLKNMIVIKSLVALVIIVLVSIIIKYINGYNYFDETFLASILIWTIVNIYDVVVIDIIWFCHSKKVRIPGTEDLDKEYKDYKFHIIEGLKGEIIGIVVCVCISLIVHFVL